MYRHCNLEWECVALVESIRRNWITMSGQCESEERESEQQTVWFSQHTSDKPRNIRSYFSLSFSLFTKKSMDSFRFSPEIIIEALSKKNQRKGRFFSALVAILHRGSTKGPDRWETKCVEEGKRFRRWRNGDIYIYTYLYRQWLTMATLVNVREGEKNLATTSESIKPASTSIRVKQTKEHVWKQTH